MNEFEKYVEQRWHAQLPLPVDSRHIPYPVVAALGLSGETGEVIELLKKHLRDGKHPGGDLKLELGDVLHYLVVIAQSYGYTLADIEQANMTKLAERDTWKKKEARAL